MMNNRDKGGSVTGRWSSRQEPELQTLDPFKRPWVSGRRPWQYKDRPKWLVFDEASKITPKIWDYADAILKDGTKVEFKTCPRRSWFDCDFAEIEKRALAHYEHQCAGYLQAAQERAYLSMESKGRLHNSRRMIP